MGVSKEKRIMSDGELILLQTSTSAAASSSSSLLQRSHSSSRSEGRQQPSSSTEAAEGEDESTKHRRRDIITVIFFFVTKVMVGAAYSLMTPFFPKEAMDKGATPFAIGMIIGAAPLSVTVLSPVIGMVFNLIGMRPLMFLGLLLIGTSYTLLAFVTFIPVTWLFILVAFLLRTVEGCGSAMFTTAILTLMPALFPKHMGTLVGLVNMAASVGYSLGFPVGGALYELGGYQLPFIAIGVPVLILIIPCLLLLRKYNVKKKQLQKSLPIKGMCRIITDAIIIILFINSVMGIASMCFLQPTLETYLVDHFGLNPALVGMTAFIGTLSYLSASLPTAVVTDKLGHHRYFSVCGMALLVVYFLIISIQYFTGVPQYWCFAVGFIVNGIGSALTTMTIYPDMINQVKKSTKVGIEQEVFGPFISGLISSSLFFGEFIGNSIGGILEQFLSLPLSTLVISEMILAQTILILAISLIEYYTRIRILEPD